MIVGWYDGRRKNGRDSVNVRETKEEEEEYEKEEIKNVTSKTEWEKSASQALASVVNLRMAQLRQGDDYAE